MDHKTLSSQPIGIFDSGLGGLSILREVEKLLPNEDVIFVGDTARQPYGPRTIDEVRQYTLEITGYLVGQGVKAVIIACNTASVAGREAAQAAFPQVPVFGMVSAGVRGALRHTRSGKIGIWGTRVTVESNAHKEMLIKENPTIEAQGVACPELLRLAEKGKIDDTDHLIKLAQMHYEPLIPLQPDILVLGCTDFPCVRHIIDQVVPEGVTIIDPGEEVVLDLKSLLQENQLLKTGSANKGHYTYRVTGEDIDNFTAFTKRYMNTNEVDVRPLSLNELKGKTAE
jgi:glutamate racemase